MTECTLPQHPTEHYVSVIHALDGEATGTYYGNSVDVIKNFLIESGVPVQDQIEYFIIMKNSVYGFLIDSFNGCSIGYVLEPHVLQRLMALMGQSL